MCALVTGVQTCALPIYLVGHAVDITAHDAIAGGAIDGVEADLRRFRRGRHHRHRTGDEGELQIALPEGALRHAGSTSGRAKRFLLTPPAESAAAARLQGQALRPVSRQPLLWRGRPPAYPR